MWPTSIGEARDGVAWDFAGVPLRAVPYLLEGYRAAALEADETVEARIL